ncbi:MAG: HAMP domain-containing sensor histidine kinase, partial [Mobilitalea sp.]
MKLWKKIFLSILMVSLTVLSISSYYLINRSHLDNVTREQERSLNDYELIQSALENGIDFNTTTDDSLKLLFSHYVDYYNQKGIYLMLFHKKDKVFNEFTKISSNRYQDLLSVGEGSKQIQILAESNQHYIFVSGTMTKADYCLVYARNISTLYLARTRSVSLSILMAAGLIILLGLLSYLYSRWITKPIELLNLGADAISKGNYSIRIPATKDEFNELGTAFNKMATAVEGRTNELEEKAKELQVFIDDLSHEMNTPLTSIQGYSEFLISANTSEEQRLKAAETIRTEAKRMKDIYTKLLTLSFAREHDLELTSVKIDDLFSEISDTFLVQLSEYGIRLTLLNSLRTMMIDRTLIHMLLCNLIKNSI